MPLLLARVAILLLLLVSFPVAQFLPVHAGWENGFVESVQLSTMFVGVGLAVYFAYQQKEVQWRWFAIMVIPIWMLLMGRELSWGQQF